MKSKKQKAISQSAFLILFGINCIVSGQESLVLKNSSGVEEIDQVRKEILSHPTDESNYEYRGFMLEVWESYLQQQGAIMDGRFENVHVNKSSQEDINRYSMLIDEGYLILDSIQNEISEDPLVGIKPLVPNPETVSPPDKSDIPWPQYQGTTTNVGFTGADGPVYGRIAWKFPVGLAWESRPVVEGDKVYLASPGLRHILFTLDIHTGEVINSVEQNPGSLYNTPAFASTPVLLEDHILMREMGSRGNRGNAKEVGYINRSTWELEKETYAGHIDYRVGYAPLAANEKYMVFPFSIHELEATPPETQAFSHIICKDSKTGEQIRDVHVGHTFAEPLLDDNMVFIGTKDGYVYCINASKKDRVNERIQVMAWPTNNPTTWEFKADGAVNRKVASDDKHIYFGANDGSVYCLNKETGALIWKYTVEKPVAEAFRHFSTPLVKGKHIFIGSADKNLYCLDASTGDLVFKYASSDWVRSCPVATESSVYFASMNGDLYHIDYSGKKPKELWKKRIGDHWVYADLALSGDKLILNNSDLYSYCIDTREGEVLWKFSILKAFHKKDGERILIDELAGGGYYQSKAIAADGKVYIGTPSRFVYAADAETGREIWKYELGAAISGAPIYDNNKIYIGQQGGEDDFYCLDASTGKLIWKQNIGWDWGSAAVSEGLVYIPGIDGYVNCLDANNGNIIWRYRTDKSVCSEPLIMGDHVFFGSWDGFMYKFEKRTGKLVWKLLGGGSDSGVAIGFDGKLIIPILGHSCVDAETKEVLWKPETTGINNCTAAYHDGQVFLSWGRRLIALDAGTGDINWSYEGAAGITAAVVGNNGYVYIGSGHYPYFYALNEKGNGDGTTSCMFRIKIAGGLLEATPALYKGRAYVLSAGGYFYAVE